jgi:hypothetical protein
LISSFTNDVQNLRKRNTIINLDYVNPVTETIKIRIGSGITLTKPQTTTYLETMLALILLMIEIYIHYATLGKTMEKWSFQAGARLKSILLMPYLNKYQKLMVHLKTIFCPSTFLNYNPSENNSFLSFQEKLTDQRVIKVNPIREWSLQP